MFKKISKCCLLFFSLLLAGLLGIQTCRAAQADGTEFQQINHYNTPQGFMNDIQTIFKGDDGYYHLYYLLNQNYKSDNDGTEWCHVRTKDWEHFENRGVAIPKFTSGWSAVASGSVYQNTNGFFKDLPKTALVAYFTSYTETGQHQYVAYSLDQGQSYQPYNNGQPVIKSQSKEQNARDPYIWYQDSRGKLIMYLAEGDKVGTYSSSDGKAWTYEGATILNSAALGGKDLGLIECPNLKTFYDESTASTKYALFFGANGYQYGSTTGSYYMIGHLDEKGNFVAEQEPQRLDQGSDYYAANYYQESPTRVKSIGWMGNWDYLQGQIIDDSGQDIKHIGSISSTRNLALVRRGGRYIIESYLQNSNPKSNPLRIESSAASAKLSEDKYHKELLRVSRWASQEINLTFSGNGGPVKGHLRIFIKQKDSSFSLDFNADNGVYEVKRTSSRILGQAKDNYERAYTVENGWSGQQELTIYLVADKSSLEIALPNGQTYTLVKLSTDSQMEILVETSGDNSLTADLANLEE